MVSINFLVHIIITYITDIRRTLPLLPLLPAVIHFIDNSQREHKLLAKRNDWDQEYDYIVIGGGSGGAVMASRLSEDPTKTVLLLEAGYTENIVSDVPLMAFYLQQTPMDWGFLTEPQSRSCFGLINRQSRWPRGKGLGGSSAINVMLYVRGNARDYDQWAANGADGWSWPEVFPYFIKSEDNRDPAYVETGYHGVGGPLTVSTYSSPTKIAEAFRDSGPYMGYPSADFNGPIQSTFAIPQRTIRDGQRCSVSKAYLHPAVNRTNLHILVKSYVTRIIFNEENEAIAVEFDHQFGRHVVYARNQIILSAGSINSPQILMLSGLITLGFFLFCFLELKFDFIEFDDRYRTRETFERIGHSSDR
jgi:choline dehydrogenase-like flavoprotein